MNFILILNNKIEEHVTGLFAKINAPALIFHNLLHTQNVVKHTKEIAGHYNVSEEEMLILITAAWFHDTGHLFTRPQNHEEVGCFIMEKFMADKINDINSISSIEQCIMATKLPRHPENLLQQIICDADFYHFGTKEFQENDERALEEHILKYGDPDPFQFSKATIKMLEDHSFYTNYCKALLNEQKENNIRTLQMKISETDKQQCQKININLCNKL